MSVNGAQRTYPPQLFNIYTLAFEGSSIGCILYGVYFVIAGTNVFLLRKKRYKILLFYTIFQLVLAAFYLAMVLYTGPTQSLAIFNIVGSYKLNALLLSPWPIVVINVALVLNTWTSDGFLLYRCYVVCMGNMYALALPILLYLATVGSSITWLVVGSERGAIYSTHAVRVSWICYWSCTAAMNVCASTLISARFWMYRQAVIRAIGSMQGSFYLGYMAMTLESALLYTVFVIIALIVFVLNSPLANIFFPIFGTVQSIAPSLIVYRIARGISIETDNYGNGVVVTGTIRFASLAQGQSVMHPEIFDESGMIHASMSSGDDQTGRDGSSSLIREVKKDVVV